MIELDGLVKRYDDDDPLAVDNLSLTIERGEMMVLLGPSGCGKTTTLRTIAGLVSPTAGRIAIDGDYMFDGNRIDVRARRRPISMVFQDYALWPHMRVIENVAFPLRRKGMSKAEAAKRSVDLLDLVGCAPLKDRLPSQLSGGQQQRVALARALAPNSPVILFDEPLSNLDAKLRLQLREEIRRLHRQLSFTGLYVTHDQTEALQVGTRIAVMESGRLAQVGTPGEVFRAPASLFVANFIGNRNHIAVKLGADGMVSQPEGQILGKVSGARDEQRGTVAFLWSDVYLTKETPKGSTHMILGTGTINEVFYAGETVEIQCDVNGNTILARRPGREVADFEVGEICSIGVEFENTAVYDAASQRIGVLTPP